MDDINPTGTMKKYSDIFFFNSSMGVGGVPRVVSLWANYLDEKGCRVHTVSNIKSEHFYKFNDTITHHIISINRFRQVNPARTLYNLYKFHKNLRNCVCIYNEKI